MSGNPRPSPPRKYSTYNPYAGTSTRSSSSSASQSPHPSPSRSAHRISPSGRSVPSDYSPARASRNNSPTGIPAIPEDRARTPTPPPLHPRDISSSAASAIPPAPEWRPAVVRGRDQPFPPPRGRQYPVAPRQNYTPPTTTETLAPGLPPLPDIRPPRRKIERGRGITISSPTGEDADVRRRAGMYFDITLSEWRPIPTSRQMGIPEENWARLEKGEETDTKEKKRDRLKRFGKGLVLAVKDLRSHQDKRDKDEEERKSKLRASVSAPLGTNKRG